MALSVFGSHSRISVNSRHVWIEIQLPSRWMVGGRGFLFGENGVKNSLFLIRTRFSVCKLHRHTELIWWPWSSQSMSRTFDSLVNNLYTRSVFRPKGIHCHSDGMYTWKWVSKYLYYGDPAVSVKAICGKIVGNSEMALANAHTRLNHYFKLSLPFVRSISTSMTVWRWESSIALAKSFVTLKWSQLHFTAPYGMCEVRWCQIRLICHWDWHLVKIYGGCNGKYVAPAAYVNNCSYVFPITWYPPTFTTSQESLEWWLEVANLFPVKGMYRDE